MYGENDFYTSTDSHLNSSSTPPEMSGADRPADSGSSDSSASSLSGRWTYSAPARGYARPANGSLYGQSGYPTSDGNIYSRGGASSAGGGVSGQNPVSAAGQYASPAAGPEAGFRDESSNGTVPPAPSAGNTRRHEKRQRRGMRAGGVVALCLACALVAGAAGSAGTMYFTRSVPGQAVVRTVTEKVAAPIVSTVSYEGSSGENGAAIYELATQQVVGISTTINYGYSLFGQVATASVAGSGFIISEDGYIVTNYHVIEQACESDSPITVIMYDETTYEAEVVGYDADNDIALLKIDAEGLNPAQLGDSDDIVVGQRVYAVGNALGYLNYTMTSGIVSALGRTISTEVTDAIQVFQIDAAVNSGNSGGPVYNEAGQVIGVVDAKSGVTGSDGLAFAIPISDVAHIVNQILEYGYVADKGYLGVTCSTVTAEAAKSYNMVEGAYVSSVIEGGAAEAAGILTGDIITALDGETVSGSKALTTAIKQHRAGDEVELTVWRDGEELTVRAVLDERPQEEEATDEPSAEPNPGNQYYYNYNGNGGGIEDFFRQFFGYGY